MSFPADDPEPGDDNYVSYSPPEPSRGNKLFKGLIAVMVITGIGTAIISSCMDEQGRKHPKEPAIKLEYKNNSGLERGNYYLRYEN